MSQPLALPDCLNSLNLPEEIVAVLAEARACHPISEAEQLKLIAAQQQGETFAEKAAVYALSCLRDPTIVGGFAEDQAASYGEVEAAESSGSAALQAALLAVQRLKE